MRVRVRVRVRVRARLDGRGEGLDARLHRLRQLGELR